MARVKLNGKDLVVVWCAPWRVGIAGAIKAADNRLQIEVVNRWANRLIGDKQPGDANVRTVDCAPGFLGGQKLKAGRYTFSTNQVRKYVVEFFDDCLIKLGFLAFGGQFGFQTQAVRQVSD